MKERRKIVKLYDALIWLKAQFNLAKTVIIFPDNLENGVKISVKR